MSLGNANFIYETTGAKQLWTRISQLSFRSSPVRFNGDAPSGPNFSLIQFSGKLASYIIKHKQGGKLFLGGIGSCSWKFAKIEMVARYVNCSNYDVRGPCCHLPNMIISQIF